MNTSFTLIVFLLLTVLAGCTPSPSREPSRLPALEKLAPAEIPHLADDMDGYSLRIAVERSLSFYNRVPDDRRYPLGEIEVSVDRLKATLLRFLELLNSGRLDSATIGRDFDVYRVRFDPSQPPIVTGYYEPILDGDLKPGEEYSCPVYGIPPDLVTVDLAAFHPERFAGEQLVGRVQGGKVVPYYTRREIDGERKLDGSGCELLWLRDPIDAFFLHVQGSGMIAMPGGETRRIGYAAANGRPYRSIGKLLIDRGVMSPDEMSMQALRAYLRIHPEIRDEVLHHNESYVFFRWVQEGPVGSIHVVLTPGRSIATDPRYHPRGALSFLETQKPVPDQRGEVFELQPVRRWVLNQDAGGAIKGMGRVDLFCGTGEDAEWLAGRLKQPGNLYFFLIKNMH